MRSWGRVVAVATLVSVAGCAATGDGVKQGKSVAKPAQEDPALLLLHKTARSIEQSLTSLAEAEQFEKFGQKPGEPRVYRQIAGMEAMVTMPWSGTLEQAVTKLSSVSGFTVKFTGRPPAIPILVQIGREASTVSDHMRNIGIQAGQRADIIVDPRQKIVEVRYANGGV